MSIFDGDQHIRVPKTHEVVAQRLRREIVTGRLAVGERLPSEEDLTATFGIARTTLREALRVLESQGLIEIRRGRGGGPTVTKPDLQPVAHGLAMALQMDGVTFADLDEARQLLEPQVAGRLARTRTAADLERIGSAVENAAAAAETDDPKVFGTAVVQMHETLMECSGNATLSTISRILHDLVTDYYREGAVRSDLASRRRAVRSYRKLAALIESRDAAGAEDHWRRQLRYTISAYDPQQSFDMFAEQSADAALR
jgi:GntR family transcriptional regulator, transcriptional repressor for pyruvate dehydrogenase complex